jgi:hypothetical protein
MPPAPAANPGPPPHELAATTTFGAPPAAGTADAFTDATLPPTPPDLTGPTVWTPVPQTTLVDPFTVLPPEATTRTTPVVGTAPIVPAAPVIAPRPYEVPILTVGTPYADAIGFNNPFLNAAPTNEPIGHDANRYPAG